MTRHRANPPTLPVPAAAQSAPAIPYARPVVGLTDRELIDLLQHCAALIGQVEAELQRRTRRSV